MNEREVIQIIKTKMLEWGHHRILSGAPGCCCCAMARMLIEVIEKSAGKSAASDDGVVVTVYEAGK